MPSPSSQAPKPSRTARAFGLVSAAALLFASAPAGAQVDVFPPLSNVMLLVDTSGSMEYQFDGSDVTCTPANAGPSNDRSRWIAVRSEPRTGHNRRRGLLDEPGCS
jgi:hypothetical protein